MEHRFKERLATTNLTGLHTARVGKKEASPANLASPAAVPCHVKAAWDLEAPKARLTLPNQAVLVACTEALWAVGRHSWEVRVEASALKVASADQVALVAKDLSQEVVEVEVEAEATPRCMSETLTLT